jgi:peptidoglycan hydrolase-like protein with peptidoglycan-binding domain
VRVEAGQHIAWVGDSGNAENTAPHVHFELRDPSGTLVNGYSSLVAAGGNDVGNGPRDPLIGGARLLRSGVFGADVRALQVALDGRGHTVGPVDGHFGPLTEAAVRSFQAGFGVKVDGMVGRTTRTALAGLDHNDDTGKVMSVGSRGDRVRGLQTLLARSGFEAGPADGIFGPMTLRAVLAFQKHLRLWVDGLVGPRTTSALSKWQ